MKKRHAMILTGALAVVLAAIATQLEGGAMVLPGDAAVWSPVLVALLVYLAREIKRESAKRKARKKAARPAEPKVG
jgi:peptidoglycan/LPS O-acetylase OafA/YrhL